MNDAFIDPLFEVEWLDRDKKIVVDEMYSISFCYVTQGCNHPENSNLDIMGP